MDEKYRVYAVAIPDTEDDFLQTIAGNGSVMSWSEITSDATEDDTAIAVVEAVSGWWQSL